MSFADSIADKDPVTAVNQFCQRSVSRPISKDDIVYTNHNLAAGQGCQATVKLNCMEGIEFAGEVSYDPRQAKMSAASMVLLHFQSEINAMPAQVATKKRKSPGATGAEPAASVLKTTPEGGIELAGDNPASSFKAELNTTYSKIIRRVIQKGEIIYDVFPAAGGYTASVALPGLPPPWNNMKWTGEVCAKKNDAEQQVAGVALAAVRSDPTLMAAFNAPPKPNTWVINGGMQRKGKGKGRPSYGTPVNPSTFMPNIFAAHQQAVAAAQPGFSSGFSSL